MVLSDVALDMSGSAATLFQPAEIVNNWEWIAETGICWLEQSRLSTKRKQKQKAKNTDSLQQLWERQKERGKTLYGKKQKTKKYQQKKERKKERTEIEKKDTSMISWPASINNYQERTDALATVNPAATTKRSKAMCPGVLLIIVLVVLTGLPNVCGFPGAGVAENVVAAVLARRRSERDRERLHEERIRRIVTLQNELRASVIGGESDAILPLVRRNNDADNNRSGFVASAAGSK